MKLSLGHPVLRPRFVQSGATERPKVNKPGQWRRRVTMVVTGMALLAGSGCAQQDSRATARESAGRQEVQVDMAGAAFRPVTVGARADLVLVVKVRNRDLQHHTFTADSAGVDVELAPGKEATFSIPARPNGTNTYYLCRFHEADGMKGKISHLTSL